MCKRCFDVTVSLLCTLLLLPAMLIVALGCKLDSEGPVLHRAIRCGKDGRPFKMYKFRTMVVGAAAGGPGVTRRGDPRVTRLGRLLRKTKLDELPQLFNVFKGDMSLVGPRPEDPRFVSRYNPEQRRVLAVRPGIVSRTSLLYRDEESLLQREGGDVEATYLRRVLPEKLRLDLAYVNHHSLAGDVAVLTWTARVLLSHGTGPSATPNSQLQVR